MVLVKPGADASTRRKGLARFVTHRLYHRRLVRSGALVLAAGGLDTATS
jgi:hypothetical protein